jgi:glycosyltransferase involved in cell wall biosynthesis
MSKALRIANFMDSPIELLERKGNLGSALMLYNPLKQAEKVVHFTPNYGDLRFAEQFEEAGIEIYPFFDNKVKSLFRCVFSVLLSLGKVILKIKREQVNIIRCRLPYFGAFYGCLVGNFLNIPVVVSLGGDNRIVQQREGRYYFRSRWISYGLEKANLLMCTKIIAPNQFTKRYVANIIGVKLAERKVIVLPWILERQKVRVDVPEDVHSFFGLDRNLPFVIIVGAINRYKYSEIMFEVAQQVGPKVQVVFCGDGPLRAEGEEKLEACGYVHFIGWCDNKTVLSLISASSVVLVPMSGFVLLEAASIGKPVIASRIEWHGELVEDGFNGLLVQVDDVAAWVGGIRKIVANEALATKFSVRLKEKFEEEYDPKTLLTKELKLYESLRSKG